MPPLFTSTTFSTLLRKVASAAKQVHPSLPARALPRVQGGQGTALKRARQIVEQVVRETFPSISPAYRFNAALEPGRLSPSWGLSRPGASSVRYGSTSAFRTAYRLPAGAPRGPSMNAQVGLGTARTFASGPTQTIIQSKVPMGFRALASVLGDEQHEHALPRASRYRPYSKPKVPRLRRVRRAPAVRSVNSTILTELSHYFPLSRPTKTTAPVPLPPAPETLVTPGRTTTLSLPLAPSFHALLEPTMRVSYSETEIGVTIFANLLRGVLPLHEAFDTYASHRIAPLFYKLDSLGVLRKPEPEAPGVMLELERDAEGRPDILHVVFSRRSRSDVRAILGESLRAGEEEEWWAIQEATARTQTTLDPEAQHLTVAESQAIMEDWETALNLPRTSSGVDLVFPTLDASPNPQGIDMTSTFTDSWPSSRTLTPLSSFSPGSYLITSPSSDISSLSDDFPASLTASLLSELSNEPPSSAWEVSPSDEDSDVESAISVQLDSSEIWSEGMIEGVGPPSPGALVGWSGAGEGFGLAQPW